MTTWSADDLRRIAETDDLRVSPAVDAAYRQKYEPTLYLAPMISRPVRAATVQISPRTS